MSTYLVTGAGRGLGLELTKQLAERIDVSKVLATTRNEASPALKEVIAASPSKVSYIICDVSSPQSVEHAMSLIAGELGEQGLDVLINNVGMQTPVQGGIANMPDEQLATIFNANVISAHRMTKTMLPLLRKGKARKVVNIGTTVGSISMAPAFAYAPQPAYKVTKAALNMLTVQYALDYHKEGFTFVVLSPGWLQTDLGGPELRAMADLPVSEGAARCIDQIFAAGLAQNGKFLNIHVPGWEQKGLAQRYDGKSPPW